MWFDGERQPNTLYVASVSRGKDSTAMLRAIQLMGWPLDAVVSVDVWATQDIPAELPPMVEFKDKWDKKCIEIFGIPVTRVCATKRERERVQQTESVTHDCHTQTCSTNSTSLEDMVSTSAGSRAQYTHGVSDSKTLKAEETLSKLTYENVFYRPTEAKKAQAHGVGCLGYQNLGFASRRVPYCNSELKARCLDKFSPEPANDGQKTNIVHYIGIAADEPIRIKRHIDNKNKVLPLVQIGWDEELCGLEATYLDMLAPTYTDGTRDGCWFCHNQTVDSLRRLRHNYPDLWSILMKWDTDSPTTFHPDGHTVHDFDKRFSLEDDGVIKEEDRWRWKYLTSPPERQISVDKAVS